MRRIPNRKLPWRPWSKIAKHHPCVDACIVESIHHRFHNCRAYTTEELNNCAMAESCTTLALIKGGSPHDSTSDMHI